MLHRHNPRHLTGALTLFAIGALLLVTPPRASATGVNLNPPRNPAAAAPAARGHLEVPTGAWCTTTGADRSGQQVRPIPAQNPCQDLPRMQYILKRMESIAKDANRAAILTCSGNHASPVRCTIAQAVARRAWAQYYAYRWQVAVCSR